MMSPRVSCELAESPSEGLLHSGASQSSTCVSRRPKLEGVCAGDWHDFASGRVAGVLIIKVKGSTSYSPMTSVDG